MKIEMFDDFLKDYYDNMSFSELSQKYHVCRSNLFKYLKQYQVERRPIRGKHPRYNAKYKINTSYFDCIDNEHKAYWIGFLIADGYIGSRLISIALQRQDRYLLERFLQDLESNHPIKINKDNNPYISISCKQIAETLNKYGFNNRKSYFLNIDQILSFVPEKLIHHCIRGMIDGDGCIKKYTYDYLKKPQYHFGYTGLQNVCQSVEKNLNVQLRSIKEKGVAWTYVTRNPDIIMQIYHYLYKDATIYLDRKKVVFDEIYRDLQRL